MVRQSQIDLGLKDLAMFSDGGKDLKASQVLE
jgi:hypothetical protein